MRAVGYTAARASSRAALDRSRPVILTEGTRWVRAKSSTSMETL